MARPLKLLLYRTCKAAGLFAAARVLTRPGLRIFCYHGFSLQDEHDFRPGLFIRPDTFERRMRYLSEHGYPVMTLQHAVAGLEAGALPANATVLTIDDGFYDVLKIAAPILERHGHRATLYVTSYYAGKETPVFRLAIQYMFWKTRAASIDLDGLLPLRRETVMLGDAGVKDRCLWDIIAFGETKLDEPQRVTLAESVGRRLGVPYDAIASSRLLSLMTADELRQLSASGIDMQLHTHRHHLPEEETLLDREIVENRQFLAPLTSRALAHFCYPSGIWSHRQWPWLAARGVLTATTCDVGLNYANTPRLGLRRFLDGEDISQIEFEAEVSGFSELLRRARRFIRRGAAADHQSSTSAIDRVGASA